jgi:hypothetical protein
MASEKGTLTLQIGQILESGRGDGPFTQPVNISATPYTSKQFSLLAHGIEVHSVLPVISSPSSTALEIFPST